MADPHHHSVSSAHKFGGQTSDYLHIHNWFDASKAASCDGRHRLVRHHAFGIAECVTLFGQTLITSDGRTIPTRWVAQQHVAEDFGGFIPTLSDWIQAVQLEPWMGRAAKLSKID